LVEGRRSLVEFRAPRDDNEKQRFRPGVMQGQPVIRGTRLPVYVIVEAIAAGDSRGELLRAFPFLAVEDIESSYRWYLENLLTGAGGAR